MRPDAVHQAVRDRDLTRLRSLLASGADPNCLDSTGQPPLRHVLTYGCGFVFEDETREMIIALLDAGADPSLCGVAGALVADARHMVTSACENNEAFALEQLLQTPRRPRQSKRRLRLQQTASLPGHRFIVRSGAQAFSPDGSRFVSGDIYGGLIVRERVRANWRIYRNMSVVPTSHYSQPQVFEVAWSPCGRWIATAQAGEVMLRDAETLAQVAAVRGAPLGGPLAFAGGGRWLAYGHDDLVVFDVPSLAVRLTHQVTGSIDDHAVGALTADPWGCLIAAGDDGGSREDAVGRVLAYGTPHVDIVDAGCGKLRASIASVTGRHALAWEPVSGLVLVGESNGDISLWSPDGDEIRRFHADDRGVGALGACRAFVASVSCQIYLGENKPKPRISFWDPANGECLGAVELGEHVLAPSWIAPSPDGKALWAAGGREGDDFLISMWEIDTGSF